MGEIALDGLLRPIKVAFPIAIQVLKDGLKGLFYRKKMPKKQLLYRGLMSMECRRCWK